MATQCPTEHEDFQERIKELEKENTELKIELTRKSDRINELEEQLKHWLDVLVETIQETLGSESDD